MSCSALFDRSSLLVVALAKCSFAFVREACFQASQHSCSTRPMEASRPHSAGDGEFIRRSRERLSRALSSRRSCGPWRDRPCAPSPYRPRAWFAVEDRNPGRLHGTHGREAFLRNLGDVRVLSGPRLGGRNSLIEIDFVSAFARQVLQSWWLATSAATRVERERIMFVSCLWRRAPMVRRRKAFAQGGAEPRRSCAEFRQTNTLW